MSSTAWRDAGQNRGRDACIEVEMFDFPITVKSIDDVPEEYRILYELNDDGEGATLIAALKSRIEGVGPAGQRALQEERKARAAAEKAAKAWKEAAGVDTPEELAAKFEEIESEWQQKLQEAQAAKGGGDKDNEDLNKRLQQVRNEVEREWSKKLDREIAERKKAEEERDQMFQDMQRNMLEREAMEAIAAHKGRPALLRREVMAQLKLVKTDSGWKVRVVDEDGDERYDGDGKPMSVHNLVALMRQSDDYAAAFDGDGASGSGSRSPAGGTKVTVKTNPWSKATFNATEQAKILKSNPQLAKQLQAQAEAEARR